MVSPHSMPRDGAQVGEDLGNSLIIKACFMLCLMAWPLPAPLRPGSPLPVGESGVSALQASDVGSRVGGALGDRLVAKNHKQMLLSLHNM